MKSRYLVLGGSFFFVFIFALTLGITLSDTQLRTLASTHCAKTGGTWNNQNYCEKIVSVCQPQTL